MAITLTTTPVYALPGDAVPLTATVDTAANFVRLWCTDAPEGSVLKNRLVKENATQIEILPPKTTPSGGIAVSVPFNAQFDVGGRYTFSAQEYTQGATSTGGGYANDPQGYSSLTPIGALQTLYVYIGQRMTQYIGSAAYGSGSLLVYVWNDTIRETTVTTHGLVSPAIIDTSTPRAAAAASASGVLTQLALFKNAAVSTLSPNLAALITEMKADIPKHFNNTGPAGPVNYHQNPPTGNTPDTDNDTAIEALSSRVGTPEALVRAAQVLSGRLSLHMSNGASGESYYHAKEPDYENALTANGVGSAADLSSAFAAIADVYRAYEAHRIDATSHVVPDTNNAITTVLGPLLSLHKEFLSAMRTLSPAAAGGQQTAAVVLNSYGFRLE